MDGDKVVLTTRTVRPDQKVEKPKPKQLEKVIKGSVITRKKSLGKRIKELFFGDDVPSVTGYIIHDVLIPAAKSTLSDMVSGGIEMLLFGSSRGTRTRRDKGKSYVSYTNYYKSDERDGRDSHRDRPDHSRNNRARHNFDDIIIESRGEAEEVLSHLVDMILDYDTACVADLYDLVGIPTTFVDNKYGWTDLSGATISRVRAGYMINLPKPYLLD